MKALTGTGGEAELRSRGCAERKVLKRKLFVTATAYGKLRNPDAGAFGAIGFSLSKENLSPRAKAANAKITMGRSTYTFS
jgi:hypothetical protein